MASLPENNGLPAGNKSLSSDSGLASSYLEWSLSEGQSSMVSQWTNSDNGCFETVFTQESISVTGNSAEMFANMSSKNTLPTGNGSSFSADLQRGAEMPSPNDGLFRMGNGHAADGSQHASSYSMANSANRVLIAGSTAAPDTQATGATISMLPNSGGNTGSHLPAQQQLLIGSKSRQPVRQQLGNGDKDMTDISFRQVEFAQSETGSADAGRSRPRRNVKSVYATPKKNQIQESGPPAPPKKNGRRQRSVTPDSDDPDEVSDSENILLNMDSGDFEPGPDAEEPVVQGDEGEQAAEEKDEDSDWEEELDESFESESDSDEEYVPPAKQKKQKQGSPKPAPVPKVQKAQKRQVQTTKVTNCSVVLERLESKMHLEVNSVTETIEDDKVVEQTITSDELDLIEAFTPEGSDHDESSKIQWCLPPKKGFAPIRQKAQLVYLNWMPRPLDGSGIYTAKHQIENENDNNLDGKRKIKKEFKMIDWTVDPPEEHDPNPPEKPKLRHAKPVTDSLSAFNSIFTDQVCQKICDYTNLFAKKRISGKLATREKWKDLDILELRAYIGTILFLGIHQKNRLPLEKVFTTAWYEMNLPILLAFSRDRLGAIATNLRFSETTGTVDYDKMTDPKEDRLIKIREIFDPIIENSRAMVIPGHVITVDEAVLGFKGRCPFSQYLPNKPTRYGIKVWCACDAKTGYLLNAKVYSGKVGQTITTDQGRKVCLELVKPYFKTGRLVVTDNFYTGINLALDLKDQSLGILGTLREGKAGVPQELYKIQLSDKIAKTRDAETKKMTKSKNKSKSDSEDESSDGSEDESGDEDEDGSSNNSDSDSDASDIAPPPKKKKPAPKKKPPPKKPAKATKAAVVTRADMHFVHADANEAYEFDVNEVDRTIAEIMEAVERKPLDSAPPKGKGASKFESRAAFLFTRDLTVMKALVKPKRYVYMLSTVHHEPLVSCDINTKPNMILDYNQGKFGVDLLGQVVKNFTCKQTSTRWPMRIFMWLVDVAAYNAYVLHKSAKAADPEEKAAHAFRRHFLTDLAIKLMEPLIQRRCRQEERGGKVPAHVAKVIMASRSAMQVSRGCNDEQEYRLFGDASVDMESISKAAKAKKRAANQCMECPKHCIIRPTKPVRPTCYYPKCGSNQKGTSVCYDCEKPLCGHHQRNVRLVDVPRPVILCPICHDQASEEARMQKKAGKGGPKPKAGTGTSTAESRPGNSRDNDDIESALAGTATGMLSNAKLENRPKKATGKVAAGHADSDSSSISDIEEYFKSDFDSDSSDSPSVAAAGTNLPACKQEPAD